METEGYEKSEGTFGGKICYHFYSMNSHISIFSFKQWQDLLQSHCQDTGSC